MDKNILLIGNGFDLALGYKTSYKDFYKFLIVAYQLIFLSKLNIVRIENIDQKNLKCKLEYVEINNGLSYKLVSRSNKDKFYYDFITKNYKNDDLIQIYNCIIQKDSILNYIVKGIYQQIFKLKYNPLDVSSELLKNIRIVNSKLLYKKNASNSFGSIDYKPFLQLFDSIMQKKSFFDDVIEQLSNSSSNNWCDLEKTVREYAEVINSKKDKSKESIDLIISSLDDLCNILKKYLENETLDKNDITHTDKYCYSFQNLCFFNNVINFNYTHTVEKFANNDLNLKKFPFFDRSEAEPYPAFFNRISFIHGSISSDKIVLGYSEPLGEDTAFVEWEKFYQRITKRTCNKYLEWLNEDFTIVCLGYSFSIPDSDVIKYILLSEHLKQCVIFAKDGEAQKSTVKNLVSILGREKLLELTNPIFDKKNYEDQTKLVILRLDQERSKQLDEKLHLIVEEDPRLSQHDNLNYH